MKNFTTTLMILFVALIGCETTSAQSFDFGAKAGFNLTNMIEKDDDDTYSDDYKAKPGFHLGAFAEVPITDFLIFEPALLFSTKGTKISEEYYGIELKANTNLGYLDIPLNIKGIYKVTDDIKAYGMAGPYIGMALGGKIKATTEILGEKETQNYDIEWGGDESEDDFKRMDFGLTLGAGAEMNNIIVGLSYDLGLANISPDNEDGYRVKNRVFKLSVGYRIGSY